MFLHHFPRHLHSQYDQLNFMRMLQASISSTMHHAMGPEEQGVPHVLQDTASEGGCLPGFSPSPCLEGNTCILQPSAMCMLWRVPNWCDACKGAGVLFAPPQALSLARGWCRTPL